MENQDEQKTLLREVVEGLTEEIANLTKLLTAEESKPATLSDLTPFLQRVAEAIKGLREQVKILTEAKAQPQAQASDSADVLREVRALRQELRKTPTYHISKAVQYGAGFLVVSLLVTGVLAYYATRWKTERDAFEVSDWKWRAVRQVDAKYVREVDAGFEIDSISQQNKAWILQQEQADATREAARQAAEQAKALSDQANQLEEKPITKGKKK